MENRLIKETGLDKLFTIANYLFAGILLLLVLYPLVYVLSASFSSPESLMGGRVWLFPVDIGLAGYKAVFEYKGVWIGYSNSLFYTVAGTVINVVMTIAAAYPLSRKDFYGGRTIMLIFAFTMIFSGGLIPNYLLVKELGLLNTRWALLIPNAMSIFNVVVMMSFFRSNIPAELLESAKMDGCSNFRFLLSIVLPLSGAVIAVITLFYAVGHWNSFFDALLYLSDKNKFPLQIYLREILLLNTTSDITLNVDEESKNFYLSELLKYSLIILSSLPMIVLYPFVQKYFVKGVMVGSLKG
ncbi:MULTISPECIES: carbohydrate ABC transporter permease [Paenibacillus]|uniref:Carbohydrate ABC transporter permease n=1 Tax=Paenibacillus residui TaxID=629724 RepID=A0ABW3DD76_9BACL|nr:carbohydrate ABC transporter permease [Paenibacillus sp. 32O-W]